MFTYDFLSVGNNIYVAGKHCFEDTAVLKYIDLSRSSKVKGHEGKWKFIYDFLSVVNSNYMARKHRFEDMGDNVIFTTQNAL